MSINATSKLVCFQVLHILWNICHHSTADVAAAYFMNTDLLERLLLVLSHAKDCEDKESIVTARLAVTLIFKLIQISSNLQVRLRQFILGICGTRRTRGIV